jgi:CxxC motif-containing protein (DUF1111 family)
MIEKMTTKEQDLRAILERELLPVPDPTHGLQLALNALADLACDQNWCCTSQEFVEMARIACGE